MRPDKKILFQDQVSSPQAQPIHSVIISKQQTPSLAKLSQHRLAEEQFHNQSVAQISKLSAKRSSMQTPIPKQTIQLNYGHELSESPTPKEQSFLKFQEYMKAKKERQGQRAHSVMEMAEPGVHHSKLV